MFDYNALAALDSVVRERNFVRAARELFITQSAVSQRIRQLEELIGQPVLIRSPSIKPTAAGQELLAHFRQVSLLEGEVRKKWARRGSVEAPVSISMAINTETLSTWFLEAVRPVMETGGIIADLLIDDQDRTINFLYSGRAWGCVTSVADPPYGCTSSFLGYMPYHCVATKGFENRHFRKGVNGKALLRAPAAVYGENDYMHRNYLKSHFKSYAKGKPTLHFVPSPQGLVQFAVDGLAYVLLPEVSIMNYLKDGRLTKLLPSKPYKLPLYWQVQELQTEITTKLSDRIILYARSVLEYSF